MDLFTPARCSCRAFPAVHEVPVNVHADLRLLFNVMPAQFRHLASLFRRINSPLDSGAFSRFRAGPLSR